LNEQFGPEEVDALIACIFEHHSGFSRSSLSLKAAEAIPESDYKKFRNILGRLKKGEPLQYILGETWFYGLKLKLNKNVLIPRPETEELVEWIIQSETDPQQSKGNTSASKLTILDIGTGSGCIAITLKKFLPQANVYALDISSQALEIARKNALINQVDIHFIQADILNPGFQITHPSDLPPSDLPFPGTIPFNMIVSNPPYILPSEKQNMNRNVLEHEPHMALFVNENNPLQFYKAIAGFAKNFFSKGGILFFEINESKAKDMENNLKQEGFTNIKIKQDLSGKDRMIKAKFVK
jgi:release factor glutamine methyltransferase